MTAFANNTDNGTFSAAFIEASEDTVVCYMDGVPIKKAYIDEYGIITQEALNQAKAELPDGYSTKTTPTAVYVTIPSGYNNAAVRTLLAAPRYSQTNTLYYFTKDNANIYAMSFDTSTAAAFAGWISGFIPKIGPAIALTFTVAATSRAEIATKIRNLTNANKNVRINCASSSFGTFYGVFEWSGRSIETHKIYSDGTTETVTNLQYR